jgi:hypothetical protein
MAPQRRPTCVLLAASCCCSCTNCSSAAAVAAALAGAAAPDEAAAAAADSAARTRSSSCSICTPQGRAQWHMHARVGLHAQYSTLHYSTVQCSTHSSSCTLCTRQPLKTVTATPHTDMQVQHCNEGSEAGLVEGNLLTLIHGTLRGAQMV